MRDIYLGDRVYLTTNRYNTGVYNPVRGTSFEAVGTVISVDSGAVNVRWDNGQSNYYRLRGDLTPAHGESGLASRGRVRLNTNRFGDSRFNPYKEGANSCAGTVGAIDHNSELPVQVFWDNGTVNYYDRADLGVMPVRGGE